MGIDAPSLVRVEATSTRGSDGADNSVGKGGVQAIRNGGEEKKWFVIGVVCGVNASGSDVTELLRFAGALACLSVETGLESGLSKALLVRVGNFLIYWMRRSARPIDLL